ncbi:hypothetical protein HW132_20120 [Brasilonema sp. CT11]|nr:hypothetical protein [Brasilonema sp. CT11]
MRKYGHHEIFNPVPCSLFPVPCSLFPAIDERTSNGCRFIDASKITNPETTTILVNAMTTLEINSKKQDNESAKKKQKSFRYTNIGTPLTPLRPRQTKHQQHELLSDWEHAS